MSGKTADGPPLLAVSHAGPGTGGAAVLIVPGLHGSGPRHWQSVWERRHPEFVRVEQASWDRPRLGDWALALERAVLRHERVILVAHSLGCVLVAHWARCGSTARVEAGLLVAPADVDRAGASSELRSFAPTPLARLPFSTWIVASQDDPHATLARSRLFADAWGGRFLDAGRCGHLNVDSGHGSWPAGEALLQEIRRAGTASSIRRAPQGPRPEDRRSPGTREFLSLEGRSTP